MRNNILYIRNIEFEIECDWNIEFRHFSLLYRVPQENWEVDKGSAVHRTLAIWKSHKGASSSLLTTFWILFFIFRTTAVFQARFVSPKSILFINVLVCLGSTTVMYFFDDLVIIWTAIGILSAGLASTYLGFSESYILFQAIKREMNEKINRKPIKSRHHSRMLLNMFNLLVI